MSELQVIRGMSDLLPADSGVWQHIETTLRELFSAYGYREIRVPIVERTELFERSIGEATDIVEKEMYTFDDRNNVSLALRPEATAGVVRAAITNGMLHNQRHKLWTTGPMFRYEKPQKGRYRQFYQFDVEALGYAGPDVDAELIIITDHALKALGIDAVTLELNSLGTSEARAEFRSALVDYFGAHMAELDEDSRGRLERNPLRILDSKNPEMRGLIEAAPVMSDYLDRESTDHFAALCGMLDDAGIAYTINPRLVRGLDYYTRTVFEWVTDKLGAQGAVCAGGRYDGLAAKLGGQPTPAIGCAIGLERLAELYRVCGGADLSNDPQVYMVAVGQDVLRPAFRLAERLRARMPSLTLEVNCGGGSFKSQMKRADKSGAVVALVLGEDELRGETIGVKPLRSGEDQISVAWSELADALAAML